jgi:four helix bundle protein
MNKQEPIAMNGSYNFPFEKLDVWHKAKDLVKDIYAITKTFPDSERFGITQQINRSVISIASNIAEGNSRSSRREQAHFTEITYGSLMELMCQMIISNDLGYLSLQQLKDIRIKAETIARMIIALREYQKKLSG